MSLGRNYRLQIQNNTGVTIAAAGAIVTGRRWAFNSSGVQTWEASEAAIQSNSSLANAGFDNSTAIDNSTNAYLGGTFKFAVTTTGSPSGSANLILQRSTDGGTTWPDNGRGTLIATLTFTSATTLTQIVEF
jgi:hypothetical protein